MLLQPEVSRERRQPDQPQGQEIAAVEGDIEKPGQIEEERIGEMLRLVDKC